MFCAYVSPKGRTLVDWELQLPRGWCDDADRRTEANIPNTTRFATKQQLGLRMLARALDGGLPARWVSADETYSRDSKFRLELQQRQIGYMLASPCNQKVPTEGGAARAGAGRLGASDGMETAQRRCQGEGPSPVRLDGGHPAGHRHRSKTASPAGC